uniref:Transmembrane 9 superfamily member n=1 Tax=Eutreptiella gymnastica TaxID=73025 RepID=A0A7S4G828_9EUGL|mmetsp:Transcript_31366/g.50848  ORF Transcript_31366/g.50848 Transcript_31366/m.50848 type:complete len:579 (-) Transcript_31366:428-2164(-)
MRSLWVLCIFALVLTGVAHDDQKYDIGEHVPLFVDNLVPFNNPQESYRYFTLKFCKPDPLHHKSQTLGEVLQGSEKVYSGYDLRFRRDVRPARELCKASLNAEDISRFRHAIQNQYHFTWYYDEIPIKGMIGDMDHNDNCYLYTQHDFQFEYNGDRVIDARVITDAAHRVKLPEDATQLDVSFTYSSTWKDTDVVFDDRAANNANELYQEEIEIQWFSIVNSFVLVLLLTGFLAFIVMRILKKDYQRYTSLDEEEDQDETGWKLLHADVFRFPANKTLFASIIGTGLQLLMIFFIILTLSVVGVFYAYGRGTMYAAIIVVYSLTAVAAGYSSAAFYRKIEGTNWVRNVLTTVTLFALPAFLVWSVLNTVAIFYSSTVALPFGTIIALFALYFLVTFPLTLAGAIAGKNFGGSLDAPCRTKLAPREIPPAPWYRGPIVHVAVAGFLPFSAIYVELYYVFISLWGHQLFTPYGILYLVFVILLMVTACITVSLTYLQLSMENHEWWWTALTSGGATSFFIYAYCFYFLYSESKMSGFFQVSYYFGYMLLICYALFLMLGTVGFLCSFVFVKQIYRSIKCD